VVELLVLPILKFSFECFFLLLLRIMNSQIPGGYLDIISDTWPVFYSDQPKQNAGTVITCFKILYSSAFLRHRVWSNPGGVHIFQIFRSNLKILGLGRVTRGKFDISRHGDPVLGLVYPLSVRATPIMFQHGESSCEAPGGTVGPCVTINSIFNHTCPYVN